MSAFSTPRADAIRALIRGPGGHMHPDIATEAVDEVFSQLADPDAEMVAAGVAELRTWLSVDRPQRASAAVERIWCAMLDRARK